MIVDRPDPTVAEFERDTGWKLEPEGACRGGICVPLPGDAVRGDRVGVEAVAGALGMPIVEAPKLGVRALGPAVLGGRALDTAAVGDVELETLAGEAVPLSRYAGEKLLVYAWAPY